MAYMSDDSVIFILWVQRHKSIYTHLYNISQNKYFLYPDTVVHVFNPNILEAEVCGQLLLYIMCQESQRYMVRPCLKQTKISNKNISFVFCPFISPDCVNPANHWSFFTVFTDSTFLACHMLWICRHFTEPSFLSLFLIAHFLALNNIPLSSYTTLPQFLYWRTFWFLLI